MRGLMVAVVVMGVLIVAGVVVLAVEMIHRVSAASAPGVMPPVALDEPAGTRIGGVSLSADRMAVLLTGGGPDRAVIVDLRSGRRVGAVSLGR